ncbi:hypothetical protein B6264_26970 [Kitasatospora aureofaciens]|nr:hypothetical protein B6264_26970 [Kitasatospora aureofaciens]
MGGEEFGGAAVGEAGAAGVGAAVRRGGVGGGSAVGEEERAFGAAGDEEGEEPGGARPPVDGGVPGAGAAVREVEVVGVQRQDGFDREAGLVQQVPQRLLAQRGA